jgi:hypothetical protein
VSKQLTESSPRRKFGSIRGAWASRSAAKDRGPNGAVISSPSPRMDEATSPRSLSGLWDCAKTSSLSEKIDVLRKVYSNDQYCQIFVQFAKAKHAEENVLFLCDVVKLRAADVSRRGDLYAKLVAEYLDSSSEREVNLSSKAKKNLLNATAFEDLSFLEPAWKEVEHQVVQNLCGPFLELLPGKGDACSPESIHSSPEDDEVSNAS